MGNVDVWTRPISPAGSWAFAFVNHGSGGGPQIVKVALKSLGLTSTGGYNVTEAFDGRPYGKLLPGGFVTAAVNPSGVFLAVAVRL